MITAGIGSTNTVIQTYPLAVVTIYLTGTVTLAPIYTDEGGTIPKANPFVAGSDASWSAYIAEGRYDIRFSGPSVPTPYTLSDVTVGGAGGGGGSFHLLSDYDGLQDAITQLGSDPVTLFYDVLAEDTLTLTVPENITSVVIDGGGIEVQTGEIVEIVGPWVAPPIKTFYNIGPGLGTIDVSLNSQTSEYYPEWWGAVGDATTDDTAAWQACADAVDDNKTIVLLPNKGWKLTSTLTFSRRFQLKIKGPGGNVGVNGEFRPYFIWYGVNGTAPVITLHNLYACEVSNFRVFSGNGGSGYSDGTDCGILLTNSPGGSPNISNRTTLSGLLIQANTSRPGWIGLRINNFGFGNDEQHLIEHCLFDGYGTPNPDLSLNVGTCLEMADYQVKGVTLYRNTYQNAEYGAVIQGNFHSRDEVMVSLRVGWRLSYITETASIEGLDEENVKIPLQAIQMPGPSCLHVNSCRFSILTGLGVSLTSGVPAFDLQAGIITFSSCFFDAPAGGVGAYLFRDTVGVSGTVLNLFNCSAGQSGSLQQFITKILAGLSSFGAYSILSGGSWIVGPTITTTEGYYGSAYNSRSLVTLEGSSGGPGGGNIRENYNDGGVTVGGGALQVGGLARPAALLPTLVGSQPSPTNRNFCVLARDANGLRTIPSPPTGNFATAGTLNGSNYIAFQWPKVTGATDYQLLEINTANNWEFRVVATIVAASNPETYNLQANPAGSYISTLDYLTNPSSTIAAPLYNETGYVTQFGSKGHLAKTTQAYTVKPYDLLITCDATGGNYTVTLPAASAANRGQRYVFVRIDASGNLPTISGGGTNIDGAATYTGLSAQYKRLVVFSGETQWFIESAN